jgi:hypothetical protein
VTRARAQRIPDPVIDEALARARAVQERSDGILAIGVGHKHRRATGYGDVARVAIKFTVRTKPAQVPARERIPKWFQIAHRGQSYRVPTDVEPIGVLRRQTLGPCQVRVGAQVGYEGTAGPLLRDPGGQPYLLTAGHVLFNDKNDNPWGAPNLPVFLDGTPIGTGIAADTYFESNGMRVDVGVIRLDGGVPAALQGPPWTTFDRVVTEQELLAMSRTGGDTVGLQLYGWISSPLATFDELNQTGLPVDDDTYAPFLIKVRAQVDLFREGDSGACLARQDGVLVGLHVLANTADQSIGWSLALPSVLAYIKLKTGLKLTL